jgi:hypothetical protein
LGNGLIVKIVFLCLLIKMLSIAVDEELLVLVGKSTVLYKLYDARRESDLCLLLVLVR